ncbi:MAG TPA: GGDEF domain-containing protein [Devosiaceae bacterium]|nr:GGDEF domain-containing protein [Devosiaceae bacterium]
MAIKSRGPGGSRMELDSFTLFAANVVVLAVMAAAFGVAGRGRTAERHWNSWLTGNLVLAAALVFFMYERHLPEIVVATVPNGLLVAGFGLRWLAARQFSGRPDKLYLALAPSALFVMLSLTPAVFGSYAAVYSLTNVLLTGIAAATAFEFWRDRQDGLPSRYGLVFAYGVIAASFAARVLQGMLGGDSIDRYLPNDLMLDIHLAIAIVHTTASGAFALSVAYERSAQGLRNAAMRDPLTGLYNRRAFEAHVEERLAGNLGGEFAVVFLDIDNFKLVNDRYGHAVGDEAIRQCASIAAASMRQGDFIARIGGEEFAAILTDISAEDAYERIDSIRGEVSAAAILPGPAQEVLTVSAGICHSSSGFRDFDELMKLADRGLYKAKHLGRNRVEQLAA